MSERSDETPDAPAPRQGNAGVVQAVVRADGTGEVTLDGAVHRVSTPSIAEAGGAVTGMIAQVAATLGRPVAAQVRDPDGLWSLMIHPDGSVEEASAALAETRGRRGHSDEDGEPARPADAPDPGAVAGAVVAQDHGAAGAGLGMPVVAPPAGASPAGVPPAGVSPVGASPLAGPLPTLDDLLSTRRRAPKGPAETGWRLGIRRATAGVVAPGPGRDERRHRAAVETVRRSLDGPRTIVVLNPKGGAHKTTAALLMAATFGIHRGGYTLAWDNNETRGTLGWRSEHGQHSNTAVNLLQDLPSFTDLGVVRVGDLDNYVRSQGTSQFDVLASDEDAASAASIDAAAFTALHRTLSRFYRVIVVDTGNNMRASNWQAAVAAADQLVIVSTVREDTAQSAAWAIDALRATGHEDAVRRAVTVLSAPEPKVDKQLRKRLHQHFGALTRAVLDVPHDRALIPGGPIEYDALSSQTREAWLRVTATVAEGL